MENSVLLFQRPKTTRPSLEKRMYRLAWLLHILKMRKCFIWFCIFKNSCYPDSFNERQQIICACALVQEKYIKLLICRGNILQVLFPFLLYFDLVRMVCSYQTWKSLGAVVWLKVSMVMVGIHRKQNHKSTKDSIVLASLTSQPAAEII